MSHTLDRLTSIAKALKPNNQEKEVSERRDRATKLKGILIRHLDVLRERVGRELKSLPQEKADRAHAIMRAADEGREDFLEEYGFVKQCAWFSDILKAMIDGRAPIEVQAIMATPERLVGTATGKSAIKPFMPSRTDEINMELTLLFKKMGHVCGGAVRPIITINDLRDKTKKYKLTKKEQDVYAEAVLETMRERGVIAEKDVIGGSFNVDRYSRSAGRVDALIARLRNCDLGDVQVDRLGNVYFFPSERLLTMHCMSSPMRLWEVRATGILIRDSAGEPTDAALFAASFSDQLNRLITHVIPLRVTYTDLQDRTFTLLRAIDFVRGQRYHDMSFDPELTSPALTAYICAQLFLKKLQKILDNNARFNSWEEVDDFEYAARNYGTIMPEDVAIITHVSRLFKHIGIPLNSLTKVAEIGSASNLYPTMLLAPYVNPTASIQLLEYSPNRGYLQQVINGTIQPDHAALWNKFERLMVRVGGDRYEGCEARAKKQAVVKFGNVFALPKNEYEFISSYFLAESIVDSLMPFCEAIQSLADALQPGGMIMNAHMMASDGWSTGVGTQFPAVSLTTSAIRHAYSEAGLDIISFEIVGENVKVKPRDGYNGMAIIIATRRK